MSQEKRVSIKIKAPLREVAETGPLCQAGADELFCGIEPPQWRKKYKNFLINQRLTSANFTRMSDLEKAIAIAHRYGVKVHVAMNAFFYMTRQYGMVQKIIKDVVKIGADGFILADPGLLWAIDKKILKLKDIVIGCDAVILNSAAVAMYKEHGASRVVLPRAMTLAEIQDITQRDSSIEYEVFILNDLCFFIDGLCAYCKDNPGQIENEGSGGAGVSFYSASRLLARGYNGGCRVRFHRQKMSVRGERPAGNSRPFTFWMKRHIEGCGACAIYDFNFLGVRYLKILDRNLSLEERIKATRFIKHCVDMLGDARLSRHNYINRCRRFFKTTFQTQCSCFDCYYPSVFLPDLDRHGACNTHTKR